MTELGQQETTLRQGIQALRHGPVTSQSAESTYEALKTYGSDLTQLAREGQLDPVIGRDEEIRRVVPGPFKCELEMSDHNVKEHDSTNRKDHKYVILYNNILYYIMYIIYIMSFVEVFESVGSGADLGQAQQEQPSADR